MGRRKRPVVREEWVKCHSCGVLVRQDQAPRHECSLVAKPERKRRKESVSNADSLSGACEDRLLTSAECASRYWPVEEALPCVVCGIDLDGFEAARFARACREGELVLSLDMPIASAVPAAWTLWCSQEGIPEVVRDG